MTDWRTYRKPPVAKRSEVPGLGLVLVASFLPYLTIGPLAVPSQVQPWASLIAWVWVIARLASRGVAISGTQWLLIIFALWFMLYIYEGEGVDLTTYFRRSGAFLLSAGIFLAVQYATPTLLWRVLKLTLPIWFAFAVLRYVAAPIYFAVVTPLVPTVVVSSERGASSLAPEATDFGYTMVFMVAFCMICRYLLRQQGESPERWPLWLAVGSAVLSLSGTGIFGLALVLMIFLATREAARLGRAGQSIVSVVAVVAGFVVLSSLQTTGVRGLDLLSGVVQSPGDLVNSTASYRLVHNAVGVLGLVDSGFKGYGAGAFLIEGPQVYLRHDLGGFFGLSGYYAVNVPATLTQSPVSFMAVILLEYGLVGIIYLLVLFGYVARSRIPFKAIVTVLMLIAWAQSFPAAWPPFWVMLGLTMSPNFRKSTSPGQEIAGQLSEK